ncbi:MAG: ABC transporter substrate-binding protein, partial [Candidatus Hodarchaeota archaeon]
MTRTQLYLVVAVIVVIIIGAALAAYYFLLPAEAAPIKVGALLDLSGTGAATGIEMTPAIRLWEYEVNEIQGGLLGRKVQVVFADTESNPDKGRLAFERLVLEEQVVAVIGGGYSSVAMAYTPDANTYGVPTLFTIQSSMALQDIMAQGKYVWRPWGNIEGWAAAMVGTIKDVIIPMIQDEYPSVQVNEIRWQLIRSDDEAARSAAEETHKYMDDWLDDVVKMDDIVVPVTQQDMSSELVIIDQRNVDIITAVFWTVQSPIWVKQFSEAGLPCITGGLGDISSAEVFWDATGDTRLGVFGMAYYPIWVNMTTKTAHYRNLFREYWGFDSSPIASHIYDAALVLQDAIERAGSVEREAIADALATTDFLGIKRQIKFDPNTHDIQDPWMVMVQYVAGTGPNSKDGIKMIAVYPASFEEAPGPWLPDYYVPSK